MIGKSEWGFCWGMYKQVKPTSVTD